ncbi:MAG: hypothetical protein P8N67_05215 [Pseudomonadales bacterium]|nr:hypothetical protein [Pseudomonadales bacterium]
MSLLNTWKAQSAESRQTYTVLLALSVLGVISHLVPHSAGMSTVGAIGMMAAALLPRHLLPVPVLLSIVAFDLINGTYQIAAMAFVYLAHLAAAWSLTPVLSPAKKKISLPSFGGAAVLSAVVFYAVSNATPIALGFYPNTVEGWMACYLAGLPFLLKGVLANVIFGGVAFTGIWLARKVANGDVARLTSSQ